LRSKKQKSKNLAAARWGEKLTAAEKSEIGRQNGAARWAKVSPEDRSKEMKKVASKGAGRPRQAGKRCKCGRMTLKRARARAGATGTSAGHDPGCTFYRK
jgi:hypothetical protein